MNGITINIDPVIFHLGSLEIRWYSVAVLSAIVAAVLIAIREGKKKGIAENEILPLAVWAVIGGILGARLFHVIDKFGYYTSHPSQIIEFQGLAIWGALAGGGLAVVLYAKVKHLPLARLADAVVPALLVAQIIGRLGCIVNGDAYGSQTSLPWGFIYTNPDAMIPRSLFGVPTHPYPLYEMILNAATLVILLKLRRYFKTDGAFFLTYLSFYAVTRFFLTFVREEKVWFWGLQEAQVIAIAILIGSIAALLHIARHPAGKLPTEEATPAIRY